MEDQKKQMKIYESINEFFGRLLELRDKGKDLFLKYFQFLRKVPDHAPFNNTLVFIQNPQCGYYATAKQWLKRFNRTIKKDVRPMVILFPFGPVEFVYDVNDTEGEEITDEKILFWWRENGGTLDGKIMENTYLNLKKIGVDFKHIDVRKYFEKVRYRTAGFAQRTLSNNEVSITLHPRYDGKDVESYGVLCHEIAHILLGHLGRKSIHKQQKEKIIASDRSGIPINIQELEAELVAWIVFSSLGIEKNSESYMASWLISERDFINIGMCDVLRVAGKIQEMGERKNVF